MISRHAMTTPKARWLSMFAMLAIVSLAVASCSSGDDSADSLSATSLTEAGENDSPTTTAAELDGETDTGTEADTEPQPETVPPVFEIMATEPTAPGPRPMLAWDSIDGATTYDLIVLDAEGTPYWAWSGEETGVHLGGVENPDAVGAWVFEPLTWIVTARDSEGEPLAMSAKAELLP